MIAFGDKQAQKLMLNGAEVSKAFVGNKQVFPVSAPPSLDQQVQAILAGREGCVFDFTDWTTLRQDNAQTIPVDVIGQPIGSIVSKWGTLVYRFGQGTDARRPTVVAGGALFDGVDDLLQGDAAAVGFLNNAPAVTVGMSFDHTAIDGVRHQLYFSQPSATNSNRCDFLTNTSGQGRGLVRRKAADPAANITTVAGTLTAGVEYTFLSQADFGDSELIFRINSVEQGKTAISGTGNAEPANSAQATIGALRAVNNPHKGRIRRVFLSRFTLTDTERDTVEAWLNPTTGGA